MFRSTDRGDTWEKISPDLTRGIDRNKLPMRGGVPDSTALGRNEGTAEFSNITTIDESPLRKDLLAVGTDDGSIQVTRDGGKTWTKTDKFPERARDDVREPRRLVAGGRGNDLRHARRPSQQRLQAVRREEHRLRHDVDVDRRRISRTAARCR